MPRYVVGCRFYCAGLNNAVSSLFLLDSGADTTTIVAERFGLRFKSLKKGSVALTPAGPIKTRVVEDVILVFLTENAKRHAEVLDRADVISLPVSPYHGMLGMDILGRFNWQREQYVWRLKK
jgi:hypothetical protein